MPAARRTVRGHRAGAGRAAVRRAGLAEGQGPDAVDISIRHEPLARAGGCRGDHRARGECREPASKLINFKITPGALPCGDPRRTSRDPRPGETRSEEHTSE